MNRRRGTEINAIRLKAVGWLTRTRRSSGGADGSGSHHPLDQQIAAIALVNGLNTADFVSSGVGLKEAFV
jgi:hypothetical protein